MTGMISKRLGHMAALFCSVLSGIVEVRHVCMPSLNSATLFRYHVTLNGSFLEALADEGRTGYA
jgi:hypothetical protein